MIFFSQFESVYLWLPLIGFIIGFIGSMLGGGGGFFFIPVLTLLFKVPAQVAVATSLAATLPIGIVGSLGHHRNNNIDVPLGIAFAVTGILGAFVGASITNLITTGQLKDSFGVYSILMASFLIFGNLKEKRAEINGKQIPSGSTFQKMTKGSFFGVLSGVITATFGTTGTAPVQAAMFSMRMPLKLVVGTSLLVSTVNTFSSLGAHFLVGRIDLSLVAFLTSGTIIGSLFGPKFLAGIKFGRTEAPIRFWYAIGMIAFGIVMIIA
jgi:uncharacterized membrane protein YfcA